MGSKPIVSIIIVNWNGGLVFEECLKSLSEVEKPSWELIVIDNGSTDGSQFLTDKIHLPAPIKLIQNKKNLGFAPANNQGYQEAKGKYVLLLNNDTRVTPNFLELLTQRMEKDSSIGAVQPKIYLMDTDNLLDNAGSFITRIGFLDHWGFMQKDSKEYGKEREIFSAKGACMLIRKSVVDGIGLFDDDFVSYFEESDFCWRVWSAGWRVLFYPKATIYHKLGYTIRRQNVLNMNYNYCKNRICSLIKNLESRNLPVFLGSHLIISFGISFVFLLRFHPSNSLMIIKAIFWNISNLSSILKKRKATQKLRVVSDREIFSRVLKPVNLKKYLGDFKRIEEDMDRKFYNYISTLETKGKLKVKN